MKLTVFFENGFWVGVVEDVQESRVKACRHIFGSEPHDAEVLEFVWQEMMPLLDRTSQTVAGRDQLVRKVNPKRLAREAAAEMAQRGAGTLAQQALAKELEHRKLERKVVSKAQAEADKARKREIAVRKAKAKHRGH